MRSNPIKNLIAEAMADVASEEQKSKIDEYQREKFPPKKEELEQQTIEKPKEEAKTDSEDVGYLKITAVLPKDMARKVWDEATQRKLTKSGSGGASGVIRDALEKFFEGRIS